MGMKQVRALQKCFVGGCLRKVGEVFLVPDKLKLQTGKRPPVMELVDDEGTEAAPRRGRRRAAKTEASDDD